MTQEDPQAYLSRYGTALLDSSSLVQQARAAGVVEDIVSITETMNDQREMLSFSHLLLVLRLNSVLHPAVSRLVLPIPVHPDLVSRICKRVVMLEVHIHLPV